MTGTGLTEEQQFAANAPEAVFIKACPGAGKTRVVVARLRRLADNLGTRRGVAVLSFTHSAVNEFQERCARENLAHLLEHPGFIGTFDAFLRQIVVLPSGIPNCDRFPRILDAWDDLGIKIRLTGRHAAQTQGVSLDRFDPRTFTVEPDKLKWNEPKQHVAQFRIEYQEAARRRHRALRSGGLLSNACMRLLAEEKLADPAFANALGRMIAARFVEVIIDEAQDCNAFDLKVLHWLRATGVKVSVVCDPDQSIYGFRKGDRGDLAQFEGGYPQSTRLALTGNFRSTSAICRVAGTLRNQKEVDRSMLDERVHPRVLLVPYHGAPTRGIAEKFRHHLDVLGIQAEQSIVLAHRWNTALSATGTSNEREVAESGRVLQVARAIGAYWSPAATSRSREQALCALERVILEAFGLLPEGEHPAPAMVAAGLEPRRFRRQVLDLITNLPKQCEGDDEAQAAWVRELHSHIRGIELPIPERGSPARIFPKPRDGEWTKALRAHPPENLRAATIHEAKGREYEAVGVVVPPDRRSDTHTADLLHSWQHRMEDEAKRVLYVGVTRAKQFLMLAIPQEHLAVVQKLMEDGDVPFQVEPLEPTVVASSRASSRRPTARAMQNEAAP